MKNLSCCLVSSTNVNSEKAPVSMFSDKLLFMSSGFLLFELNVGLLVVVEVGTVQLQKAGTITIIIYLV